MINTDKLRGWSIECVSGEWVYSDTKEPTATTWQRRPCGHCGLFNTDEGHDGCLGTLPGVMNACCGHGEVNEAYVQFNDNTILRRKNAERVIDKLKTMEEDE